MQENVGSLEGLKIKKISGVLFDLDGSLVDSMWMWKAIDKEFLAGYGIDEIPKDLAGAIEGMSFTETAQYIQKRFCIPASVEEIEEIWNQMAYDKYKNEVNFKPGAKEFLPYLALCGIKMGIATSNSRKLAETVLVSLRAENYFDAILTASEIKKGKPAPDIYLAAAQKIGVSPEECLVFEDVPAGIVAGKAAGMQVIAVWDEFSAGLDERKQELADGCISDYRQVIAWMKKRGISG